MNELKKYCWSTTDQEMNCPTTCDTIEECISNARLLWQNQDEPFEDFDPNRYAVFIDIYTTEDIDFTEMLENFCDNLPDMVDDYLDDRYYLNEADFSLSDFNRKRIITALNPIIKRDCRFDYTGKEWIGQYKITNDGYKEIASPIKTM